MRPLPLPVCTLYNVQCAVHIEPAASLPAMLQGGDRYFQQTLLCFDHCYIAINQGWKKAGLNWICASQWLKWIYVSQWHKFM